MNIDLCPFCKENKNREDSPINKSRIIMETENFIVFPTTGGFVDNYQLIVPKKHLNCFGELNETMQKELNQIISWQKMINKKYFNKETCMFEHGALIPSDVSGKSIVHAHLHVFPNDKSLLEKINNYNFNIIQINKVEDLNYICHQYETYLYYCDVDNKKYVITHQGIPSQFLRKILAENLNIKDWNWREAPYINKIEDSINFYRCILKNNDYYKGE